MTKARPLQQRFCNHGFPNLREIPILPILSLMPEPALPVMLSMKSERQKLSMRILRYLLFLSLVIGACVRAPDRLVKHKYPNKINTRTRPIEYQQKKVYEVGDVRASNRFPSARLNDFIQLNDSTFQATISPENTPINASPWYAFQIWSGTNRSIYLRLHYTEHAHRYDPKISQDGERWTALDTHLISVMPDSIDALLRLDLTPEPLWVAAQEIQDYRRVGAWVKQWKDNPVVSIGTAGKSAQGRSLYYLNIAKGDFRERPAVVVISRQHPPEVTGYFAMQAFVEEIIQRGRENGFLDRYRLMVYPLVNPDGVDLGHFRHNTGGIDLNRDWSKYRQPEVGQITDHIVNEAREGKNEVILGLDFHSTHYDVYYTFDDSVNPKIPGFTKEWLERIKDALDMEDINEQPSGLGAPVSKGWFYQQFGAESITYEIGDETPRDFIKVKGAVSAIAMMNILLEEE